MRPRFSAAFAALAAGSTAALSRWTHRVGVSVARSAVFTPTRNAIGLILPVARVERDTIGSLSPWRSVLPPRGGGKEFGSRTTKRAAPAFALVALLVLPALDAGAQGKRTRPAEESPEQYPAGPNRDDTFYFCTACHSFRIVAQQGMSRERWDETFDFMVSRHKMVDVQGEQREQMLDYLTRAFPERRAPGGWKNPCEGK